MVEEVNFLGKTLIATIARHPSATVVMGRIHQYARKMRFMSASVTSPFLTICRHPQIPQAKVATNRAQGSSLLIPTQCTGRTTLKGCHPCACCANSTYLFHLQPLAPMRLRRCPGLAHSRRRKHGKVEINYPDYPPI